MGEPVKDNAPQPANVAVAGHELSDVGVKPLAAFLAGLTISLVVVAGFVAWLFRVFLAESSNRVSPTIVEAETQVTPGPLLQVSPTDDLDALRQREDRELHATEWVDVQRHMVRMPIERAMKLAAERGLPEWPKVTQPPEATKGQPPPTEGQVP